jgi:hypothetical protein
MQRSSLLFQRSKHSLMSLSLFDYLCFIVEQMQILNFDLNRVSHLEHIVAIVLLLH